MRLTGRDARDAVRSSFVTGALMVLAAVGVASVRAPLAAMERRVKETSDVYFLPPPEHVAALSMGYRSALADVLWAHVLVSQGLRMMEKRRFENLTRLLDSINELDPTFRDPYLYADALITLQVGETPREEVLKAREILERGARNRPLDGEVWLALGQFVAYVAPGSYLTDAEEKKRWRIEGAKMLARAAELSGPDSEIGWQAIGGASILARAGERDAAIRFLERALAVADDEELKQHIAGKLAALVEDKLAEAYKRRQDELRKLREKDLPFVGRTRFLVLGPPFDAALCAGGERRDDPRCATSWPDWAERLAPADARP
jgi:tetratricopeptide (TPR) repeat protein